MSQDLNKYFANKPATRKKVILATLFDYFITFIFTYLLFTIAFPLISSLKPVQECSNQLNNARDDVADFISSTKLRTYNQEKTGFKDSSEDAKEYITALVKTSAYIHSINYPTYLSNNTFDTTTCVKIEDTFLFETNSFKNDRLSYFYKGFIAKHNEIKLEKYYESQSEFNVEHILYESIMHYNDFSNSPFLEGTSSVFKVESYEICNYQVLNANATNILISKLVYNDNSSDLYDSLESKFYSAINFGIDLIENDCEEYKTLSDEFQKAYQNVVLTYVITYVVCYSIVYLILFLVPFFRKKEILTIGTMSLKLGFSEVLDNDIKANNIIVYFLYNYFAYFTSSIFGFLLLGILGSLFTSILPNLPLLIVELFLLILNVGSLFAMIFTKNKQNLGLFYARLILKDSTESDSIVEDSKNEQN